MTPAEHIEAWERVKLRKRERDMKTALLLREAYAEIERLRDELATNARLLARQTDLAREAETGDKIYPIFDILPRLFKTGHYIDEQDGRWWLFDGKGEGVISGETYRSLCINIIFMEL